jgi:hypothetical protein
MANLRKPLVNEREGSTDVNLRIRCNDCLRHMEEQTSLARDMIKRVHEMCNRAEQMRKPPHFIWR